MAESDSGLSLKLRHFLTGADEPTIGNVSVLSRPREWHALMVGALAALAPGFIAAAGFPDLAGAIGPGFAMSYVVGRSSKDLANVVGGKVENLHIRDALAEPAYVAAGFLLVKSPEMLPKVMGALT